MVNIGTTKNTEFAFDPSIRHAHLPCLATILELKRPFLLKTISKSICFFQKFFDFFYKQILIHFYSNNWSSSGVGNEACPDDYFYIPGSTPSDEVVNSDSDQVRYCGTKLSSQNNDTSSSTIMGITWKGKEFDVSNF